MTDRRTVYGRNTVPITSCSEFKYVLKQVILRKQRIHKKESRVGEYGHAAYQIKWNEAFSNMLTNILLLYIPRPLGVGSKDFSCLKIVMLHIKLKGHEEKH